MLPDFHYFHGSLCQLGNLGFQLHTSRLIQWHGRKEAALSGWHQRPSAYEGSRCWTCWQTSTCTLHVSLLSICMPRYFLVRVNPGYDLVMDDDWVVYSGFGVSSVLLVLKVRKCLSHWTKFWISCMYLMCQTWHRLLYSQTLTLSHCTFHTIGEAQQIIFICGGLKGL